LLFHKGKEKNAPAGNNAMGTFLCDKARENTLSGIHHSIDVDLCGSFSGKVENT
jgi:hypothetical protein